jgi:hypothetical protein
MNWMVQKLLGAVIAGFGFKLGADAYQALKTKIEKQRGNGDAEQASQADAAGASNGEGDGDPVGEQRPARAHAGGR